MNTELETREEILAALGQGKVVQFRCIGHFGDNRWGTVATNTISVLLEYFSKYTFRIKPEPKTVPLETVDIDLHRDLFYSYSDLQQAWERSEDGGES